MARRLLLAAVGAPLCALALYAAPANAGIAWAYGKCGDVPHCYALTRWYPSEAGNILNTWNYIDTTSVYAPPVTERGYSFVTNEQWTSWKEHEGWIEAGQKAGAPKHNGGSELYEFYAIDTSSGEYEEILGPSVSANTRDVYQFYSDVPGEEEAKPGEVWCIKWGGPLFPSSQEGTERCFHGLYGPATELEAGVEAATTEEPTVDGVAEGFAAGGKEDLWQEAEHKGNHAKLYHKDVKKDHEVLQEATCAAAHAPGYGSLSFGAGKGCPLGEGEGEGEGEEGEEGEGGARAHASSPVGDRPYTLAGNALQQGAAPISAAAAAQLAEREAAAAGDAAPGAVTVAEGSLGRALEVMRPGSVARVRATAGAQLEADLASSADVIEVRGGFTLEDAAVPAHARAPVGSVLRLLVDADTGELEGRWLGDSPAQPLQTLGSTQQVG